MYYLVDDRDNKSLRFAGSFDGASRTRTGDLLGAIQPSSHVESASFAALYGRAPGVPQHFPQQSAPRLAEARGPGQVCRSHRRGARASASKVRRAVGSSPTEGFKGSCKSAGCVVSLEAWSTSLCGRDSGESSVAEKGPERLGRAPSRRLHSLRRAPRILGARSRGQIGLSAPLSFAERWRELRRRRYRSDGPLV